MPYPQPRQPRNGRGSPPPGLAAAVVVLLLVTSPAGVHGQNLTGRVLVEDEVPASASFSKQLELHCPPGKVAVSGGGSLGGPVNNGQTLYQSLPLGDPPTSWVVVGRDVDGGGTQWGLRASVWCVDPPPGLETVADIGELTSFSPKSLTVYCPPGKSTIGAGYAIASSNAATVGVSEVYPYPSQQWVVRGVELLPDAADWAVAIVAVCAEVEPSLRFRSKDYSLGTRLHAEMYCPDGTFALAGGADAFPDEAALTANAIGTTYSQFLGVTASPLGSGNTVDELDTLLLCHPLGTILDDGFESGDTTQWSATVP